MVVVGCVRVHIGMCEGFRLHWATPRGVEAAASMLFSPWFLPGCLYNQMCLAVKEGFLYEE